MADWWRGAVIYQIYPRSFMDADGDGVGDIAGITERLEHVAKLGADAIWISPFYASPQKDFGYDVSDHCAIDPAMGTMADFDAMVARAHDLGLKVVTDLILCHTSDEHAWFRESRAGRTGTLSDRYVWRDPKPDGSPPNNWQSVFGGPAWTWEPRRRQYYLHLFLKEQPAVNLADDRSVDAVLDVARFWLDRGVDGFRLDALDHWTIDPMLRDNPAAALAETPAKPWGMQDHLFDKSWPATKAVTARLRALMDRYPGTTTIGEMASEPWARRVEEYTSGTENLHMAYSLSAMGEDLTRDTIAALAAGAADASLRGWPCHGVSNHDAVRIASRWCARPDGTIDRRIERMVMATILTIAGSVSMYQGDELGLTQAELRLDQIVDPFGIAFWPEYKGRDGSRTPMPWTTAPNGGFSAAERTWLPVMDDHRAEAVSVQEADADSMLASWREMLAFRRAHPALVSGRMSMAADAPEGVVAWTRSDGDDAILVVVNATGNKVTVPTDRLGKLKGVKGAPSFLGKPRASGNQKLRPHEVLVARIKRPAAEPVSTEATRFRMAD